VPQPKDCIIRIRCCRNVRREWKTLVVNWGFNNSEDALKYIIEKAKEIEPNGPAKGKVY